MKLEEHLHIIKALPIPSKRNVIIILWHFFEEHGHTRVHELAEEVTDESITLDDLLKQIYPPRPLETYESESPIEPISESLKRGMRNAREGRVTRYKPARTRKGKAQRPKPYSPFGSKGEEYP